MYDLLETGSNFAKTDGEIDTGVLDVTALVSAQEGRLALHEQWTDVVDRTLVEWGRDLSQFDDPAEGLRAPSPKVLRCAIQWAMRMREKKMAPPDRTVPNGKGGVVFERKAGGVVQTLEILEDCRVELCSFVDFHLVSRKFVG